MKKAIARTITVPMAEYTKGSDPLLLRQEMLSLSDKSGKTIGGVDTTTGLGGDTIRLYWRDRVAMVRGRDLLKMWVMSFDPDEAKDLP